MFHQVGEDCAPLLEWGHIAEALAKLDAGLPEKARAPRRAPHPAYPIPYTLYSDLPSAAALYR